MYAIKMDLRIFLTLPSRCINKYGGSGKHMKTRKFCRDIIGERWFYIYQTVVALSWPWWEDQLSQQT